MSLTSILKTAKLALEMAENAERAAEASLDAAAAGDEAGAGRGCLAAARVSTILARAAADTAGVVLELGCSSGDGGGKVCSNCRRPDHGCRLELQTKVIRRGPKISQSWRRPLLS